jgi:hypothetical protein
MGVRREAPAALAMLEKPRGASLGVTQVAPHFQADFIPRASPTLFSQKQSPLTVVYLPYPCFTSTLMSSCCLYTVPPDGNELFTIDTSRS